MGAQGKHKGARGHHHVWGNPRYALDGHVEGGVLRVGGKEDRIENGAALRKNASL